MKKAQGLPITTIIIAALALVVLVVLFAIFTGRIGIFAKAVQTCPNPCVPEDVCNAAGGTALPGEYKNPDNTNEICKKVSLAQGPVLQGPVCCSVKP